MTQTSNQRSARPWATIVGLMLALGWPLLLAVVYPSQNLQNIRQDVTVDVVEWISVVVLFAIVVFWERLPFFSTVGLTAPARRDIIIAAWLALVAVGLSAFLATRHVTIPVQHTILAQIIGIPLWVRISSVFTAGICEEILFRGYAIERLKLLTGNIWVAGLVGTAFFTLGHLPRYGFSGGLLGVALTGAILSSIYVWRRNLTGCIALHWLIDGFSLLILPAFVTLK